MFHVRSSKPGHPNQCPHQHLVLSVFLVAEHPRVVQLGVVTGFGWVVVLPEGAKDVLDPGEYFFDVLLAAYTKSSFLVSLVVVAKIVVWRSFRFNCVHALDFIHYSLYYFSNCHEIVYMYVDVVVAFAVFVLADPYVVVVSCRIEIETAERVGQVSVPALGGCAQSVESPHYDDKYTVVLQLLGTSC